MKTAIAGALLVSALLMPSTTVGAETIFDSIDLGLRPWLYAIRSDGATCWDHAFAFEVPDGPDFRLDFLEVRIGIYTGSGVGPNEIRIVVHEDADLEPGVVLEEFLLIDALPPLTDEDTLPFRIESMEHPILRAGNRYWVAAYAPEQVPHAFEAAWFINWNVPHVPHGMRLDWGDWFVAVEEAAQFRVSASPVTACDDGLDNDDDGLTDYPDDPGCGDVDWSTESPACQDGDDNDGDGFIDFDGGLSALGYVATEPDPQCQVAHKKRETPSGACGLGGELILLLSPLLWGFARRGRRV